MVLDSTVYTHMGSAGMYLGGSGEGRGAHTYSSMVKVMKTQNATEVKQEGTQKVVPSARTSTQVRNSMLPW